MVAAVITSIRLSLTGILAYYLLALNQLDLTGLTLGYPDIVLVAALIKIIGRLFGL